MSRYCELQNILVKTRNLKSGEVNRFLGLANVLNLVFDFSLLLNLFEDRRMDCNSAVLETLLSLLQTGGEVPKQPCV
jgi:hypothetical protein